MGSNASLSYIAKSKHRSLLCSVAVVTGVTPFTAAVFCLLGAGTGPGFSCHKEITKGLRP